MDPRICEGLPVGSLILLKAIHSLLFEPPALWSNVSVVSLPILKVFQLSNACWYFWRLVTLVWPPSLRVCLGRSARVQGADFRRFWAWPDSLARRRRLAGRSDPVR